MKQLTYIGVIALLSILAIAVAFDAAEAQSGEPSAKILGENLSKDGSRRTKAILTINSFEKGGDGGGPSECDGKYHSNKKKIVALSTRWFNHMKRCHKYIKIYANGRSVKAMVVDECDSNRGCKKNIIDASEAVWKALGVPKKDWGWMEVSWSDA